VELVGTKSVWGFLLIRLLLGEDASKVLGLGTFGVGVVIQEGVLGLDATVFFVMVGEFAIGVKPGFEE